MTSPMAMFARGMAPPRAVSDSIAALTAPQEATVVTAAKRLEEPMPKRWSLPSMLSPTSPAACIAAVGWLSAV